MEARAHPVCGAAPARGRARPGGSDRRLPAWPLAAQQQPRSHPCPPEGLPRDARSALRERPTQRLIHRTAVYGPVRTVVWEGRSRKAPPYPDFREVWAVDFEFQAPAGERPRPVCMMAREVRTDRLVRLWRNDLLALRQPPFDCGPDSLFVAYYASAELGCFLALSWPMPANILDLYVEHRCATNGLSTV